MIPSIEQMIDKTAIQTEAQKYLAKGQIDKAIAEWEKLVKEAPDVNAYNIIGDLYLKKGNKKLSIEFFHKAAGVFRKEGFSLKAIAIYKKIINVESKDVSSLIALGELSEEKGLTTDAIRYLLTAADTLSLEADKNKYLNIYRRVLSLEPFNIPLRDKIAEIFIKENLIQDALREFLYIARLSTDKGDPEKARVYYAKVLNLQADNKDALLGMANIYEQAGDIREATAYTQKAVDLSQNDATLLFRYAALLKKAEAYSDAIGVLCRAVELEPANTEIYRQLGEIYGITGDRHNAWKAFKTVVDSFVREDNIKAAIDIANQFRDVDMKGIGELLIFLYKKENDTEKEFKETVDLADLLLASGNTDEAMNNYREALKIHPEDIELKGKLVEHELMGAEHVEDKEKTTEDLLAEADVLIKYGMFGDAKAMLEELKLNEPANPEVHVKLKSVYHETGDKELAVTEYLILSEIYKRSGDIDKSDMFLREALEVNPEDPRLLARITAIQEEQPQGEVPGEAAPMDMESYAADIAEAEFFVRQGVTEDALSIYRRLLAASPGNADLRERISSLQESVPEAFGVEADIENIEIPEVQEEEPAAPSVAGAIAQPPKPVEPEFSTDVTEIFEEFKKGLDAEVAAEDAETHYNLGIAYKEMGLVDDAIREFQTSRKDPQYTVNSLSMLGLCYMDKGMFSLAIDAFKNALNKIPGQDETYWSTKYDLAAAYEKNGDIDKALEIFSEIYGWDSKFRQVDEKINLIKAMVNR